METKIYSFCFRRPVDDNFEVEAENEDEAKHIFWEHIKDNDWPHDLVSLDDMSVHDIPKNVKGISLKDAIKKSKKTKKSA